MQDCLAVFYREILIYRMRLLRMLSERYLGGKVGFTSSPAEGTVLRAVYPVKPGYAGSLFDHAMDQGANH